MRSALVFALGLIGVQLAGCGSCAKPSDTTAPEASAVAIAPEPPVAAPERLLADVVVATPDATWKRLQTGIGGAAAILPNTFAGVVCALAGLDPSVAREVDGAAPAYAATVETDGGGYGFAIAMKLADARRTQTMLVDAETAPFAAKDEGGVRVLSSKALPLPLAVGVARSGWLLVASTNDELAKLAPYTYRTLPTRAAPAAAVAVDVPRSALAGPIRARAASSWAGAKAWLLQRDADERQKHGGRPPDFGDAPAIVACVDAALERRLAVLGDLDALHVALDASDDDLHATVSLEPSDGAGPATKMFAAMRPGAGAPLLDAPGEASLAWLVRDDPAQRADDAREIEQCVERALGKRAGDDDAKRMRALGEAWAKGRGEWLLGSAMWGASHGVALRGPSPDADAAGRALRDAVELSRRPAFADPLKRLLAVRDVTVGTADAPPLGKVSVATLARDETKKRDPKLPPPLPVGVAWLAGGGEISVALGESPTSLLVATTKPKAKLGDDARTARAIGALESNVVAALVARWAPPAAAEKMAGPPAVVAWGRRGKSGWVRAEVGYGTLRELLKSFIAP